MCTSMFVCECCKYKKNNNKTKIQRDCENTKQTVKTPNRRNQILEIQQLSKGSKQGDLSLNSKSNTCNIYSCSINENDKLDKSKEIRMSHN